MLIDPLHPHVHEHKEWGLANASFLRISGYAIQFLAKNFWEMNPPI